MFGGESKLELLLFLSFWHTGVFLSYHFIHLGCVYDATRANLSPLPSRPTSNHPAPPTLYCFHLRMLIQIVPYRQQSIPLETSGFAQARAVTCCTHLSRRYASG